MTFVSLAASFPSVTASRNLPLPVLYPYCSPGLTFPARRVDRDPASQLDNRMTGSALRLSHCAFLRLRPIRTVPVIRSADVSRTAGFASLGRLRPGWAWSRRLAANAATSVSHHR